MTTTIPIDPILPIDFENTPHEDRSEAELDAWWDHPFSISRADGTFEVRCLDGGCWDRSTCYGIAADIEMAIALAETKLASWQAIRYQPSVSIGFGHFAVVRLPQRPDRDLEILKKCKTAEEAQAYIKAMNPSA